MSKKSFNLESCGEEEDEERRHLHRHKLHRIMQAGEEMEEKKSIGMVKIQENSEAGPRHLGLTEEKEAGKSLYICSFECNKSDKIWGAYVVRAVNLSDLLSSSLELRHVGPDSSTEAYVFDTNDPKHEIIKMDGILHQGKHAPLVVEVAGKLYALSGKPFGRSFNSFEVFDPTEGSWSLLPEFPKSGYVFSYAIAGTKFLNSRGDEGWIPVDFRKSRSPIPPLYQMANTGESPISANSGESLGTSNALPAIRANLATQELKQIKISDLEFKEVLGSGTYKDVYHGIWKASKESFVAIKGIRELNFTVGQLQRLRADFWKEAQVLDQFHHPNIVEFHGVVTNGPVLATVTEYMENGSLKQVWEGKALCPRISDYRKKLIIAIDAANGMDHLHRKGIQFLLTSRNLLLDLGDSERPKCKIGDLQLFGFEHRELVAGGFGTRPWLAPELLYSNSKSNLVTEKANVYSFGIVMGELLIRESRYSHFLPVERLAGIIKGNALPSSLYPTWISLIRRCWSSDPESRPPSQKLRWSYMQC